MESEDKRSESVISYNACLVKQVKWFTVMIFCISSVELTLGLVGRYALTTADVICVNEDTWEKQNVLGNVFLTAHTVIIMVSTMLLYRIFYSIPWSFGLVAWTDKETTKWRRKEEKKRAKEEEKQKKMDEKLET